MINKKEISDLALLLTFKPNYFRITYQLL